MGYYLSSVRTHEQTKAVVFFGEQTVKYTVCSAKNTAAFVHHEPDMLRNNVSIWVVFYYATFFFWFDNVSGYDIDDKNRELR